MRHAPGAGEVEQAGPMHAQGPRAGHRRFGRKSPYHGSLSLGLVATAGAQVCAVSL